MFTCPRVCSCRFAYMFGMKTWQSLRPCPRCNTHKRDMYKFGACQMFKQHHLWGTFHQDDWLGEFDQHMVTVTFNTRGDLDCCLNDTGLKYCKKKPFAGRLVLRRRSQTIFMKLQICCSKVHIGNAPIIHPKLWIV
jgi:hypothetical protein